MEIKLNRYIAGASYKFFILVADAAQSYFLTLIFPYAFLKTLTSKNPISVISN